MNKLKIVILALLMSVTCGLYAMDVGEPVEPQQQMLEKSPTKEGSSGISMEVWALIVTGFTTPVLIAWINNRNKK